VLDLGTVKPGSTIRIPLDTFAGSTGASVTMTGFAASDVEIYKDGGTTQRASDTGYTATTDFDSLTGLHLLIIDLSSNADAGFFAAGSEYHVAVADVTVDSQTVRAWVARFRIGYPGAILDTTIATLSSQTSFTLTSGPAEDDALNGCLVLIHDVASAVQAGFGYVSDYTGSTKTVTLAAGVTFTAAAADNISIFPPVQIFGIAGTAQTARDIGASVLLSSGTGTGQLSLSSGLVTLAAATHTGAIIPTVTTVTNQLTAAAIATGVWQDATAGDFTVASSIGKSLYTGNVVPGASGGHFIAGTNAATTVTTSFTTTFTGNLTGSVGSVTGAVGSVTGNVGGNVTGSVGSVVSTVTLAAATHTGAVIPTVTTVTNQLTATAIANAVADEFTVAEDAVEASPSPTTTAFEGSNSLSSTDDFYNGSVLYFTSGTLKGVGRKISDYTGATRLITLSPALPTAPTATDTFRILGRID
jgi:hypothetical protein